MMHTRDDADGWDDDAPVFEDDASEVTCPHCGETMSIALDPAGGEAQEYVEDCQVCCRPWRVRLWYGGAGGVDVQIQAVE